jgi:microcompartment protein CcmL/EutN
MVGAPALALHEYSGVALGLRALDALVKKAPVSVLEANLIEPGRFLLLFAGGVAEVEESARAAAELAGPELLASMWLPEAHSALLPALRGRLQLATADELDTIGIIEARDVAGTIEAADRALKDAAVSLVGLRVAGALGGRGYFLVSGRQHDVEAAISAAELRLSLRKALHRAELICRPHPEMVVWLLRAPAFALPPLMESP